MTKSHTPKTKSSKEKKIAGSGLRVLEILKALAKEPMSPNELLQGIEASSDKVYRKEIITKYLNTLKLLGLKLSKVNNKYILERNLERIDFDANNLSVMKFLEKYADNINMQTLKENIFDALNTTQKSFSDETYKILQNENIKIYKSPKNTLIKDKNVKLFEKYCKDGQKLEIKYREFSDENEQEYKIAPLKILYKKCKPVLICYDCKANQYKEFVLEYITDTTQTPQRNTKDYPSAVTFKLKNRLSRAYILKKDEKLLDRQDDYIIVSNSYEDRNILLKRLLRYYDQCEILYPKDLREHIVNLIEDMEKIYE